MDRFAMGRFAASLRAERGLSADDLACFIGSTPRRLLALENGRGMLPPDSFRALADYLNVSIAELFAGRRFTGTDAPEDVSAAQADADSYLRFCAACRSPRIRLRRAAAALIDGFLIVFLWGVLVALLHGWNTIAPACVMLAFWLLHDATGRCSAGKYILRLRIVNARTLAPASLWRRVVRNLPLLPCSMLVSPILFFTGGRRTGDLLAGTYVVDKSVRRLGGAGLAPLASARRGRTLVICLVLVPALLAAASLVILPRCAVSSGAYDAALNALRSDPRCAEALAAEKEAELISVRLSVTNAGTRMRLTILVNERSFEVTLERRDGGWHVIAINGVARGETYFTRNRPVRALRTVCSRNAEPSVSQCAL